MNSLNQTDNENYDSTDVKQDGEYTEDLDSSAN